MSIATAFPPPRQSVTMPVLAPFLFMTPSMVIKQRVPLLPNGCPIDTAPPC